MPELNPPPAQVWFSYPQTGTLRNFLTREVLYGNLYVTEDDALCLVADDGMLIFKAQMTEIITYKSRMAQAMTLFFIEGEKFSINFAMNLTPTRIREMDRKWLPQPHFPSEQYIESMRQYEEFFTRNKVERSR